MYFTYSRNAIVYLYSELKEYEGALSDYSKAIEINLQLVEAYNNRGILYAQMGNKQQATQDLQTASELFRSSGNMAAYEYVIGILQQL